MLKQVASVIRTSLVLLMVLPAIGLVLFGPRASVETPPDRVVVRYWEKWTDFEGEAMKRLVDVFNETVGKDQGIFVQYAATTQIDIKSLIAIAGGDPPDLIGLFPKDIISYAGKGALLPLDEQAAAAGIDEAMIPIYRDQCTYRGHLYGVTLTPWSLAMYYNREILREFAAPLSAAGLDPNRAPRTTAELLEFCRIVQRRNEKQQLEALAYLPSHSGKIGWYYHTWPIWFGGHLVDPETGLYTPNAPEHRAGFGWVQEYCEMIGHAELGLFESSLANFNAPDNPFMIGKLAMMRQGPWFANMIRQYAPELDYGAAPVPTVDGIERSYVGQDVLVIPTGAKQPKEAWVFIEWLYLSEPINVPARKPGEHEGYDHYVTVEDGKRVKHPMPALRPIEWICWIHYKNSPLENPSEVFLETHPNPVIEMHERLARNPMAQVDPKLSNWSELEDALNAAYSDIWRSGKDVEERWLKLQERVNTLNEIARKSYARYGETYP